MAGYGHGNKNNFKGGSIKRTKAKKAKKSKKSKKVKLGGGSCGNHHGKKMTGGGSCGRKRMNGGGSCGSYHFRSKAMKGAGAHHANKRAGGFIRDGSVQNLMMRVSDKKKCKN
jgi:hypothetical protein